MEKQNIDYAKEIKKLKDAIKRLEKKCKDLGSKADDLGLKLFNMSDMKNSNNSTERLRYQEMNLEYCSTKYDLEIAKTLIIFKKEEIKNLEEQSNQELQENMPQPE